jgi:hypothetical protein
VPPKNNFSPDPAARAPLARKIQFFGEYYCTVVRAQTSLILGEQGGAGLGNGLVRSLPQTLPRV